MAVKQETEPDLGVPKPGETERQAKIRAMTEKIRAERRQAQEASEGEKSEQELRRKASAAQLQKSKAEEENRKMSSLLSALQEKVQSAEDEVERVSILAAPLSMEAVSEIKDLQMSAIRDTERAARAAGVIVDSARREVEKHKREFESMAPSAKDGASLEISKLEQRLDSAKAKIDEHKNLRKDHELAMAAEKLFEDLSIRVSGVEIDCEKAAIMAEPIAKADLEVSTAEIREAKEALRMAQASLAPTMRLISGKVVGLKGALRAKMLELQSRAEASQALLDRAQQVVEEAQSRAAALPILQQAVERMSAVEEVLEKMRETEAPFLMGIENLPDEEAGGALLKMDKASVLALSALADANKYISLKIVELNRLAESTAETARAELEKAKRQIDNNVERVRKFQADASKRRRAHLVFTIKEYVDEAEAAISKLKAAAGQLRTALPENLLDVLEEAHAAELEAQNAVTVARREVQEKQQEIRPLEGGQADVLKGNSEVLRAKVRVNHMEAELTRFRKLAEETAEKVKVGKSLAETFEIIKDAESETERLLAASQQWPENQKPPAEDEQSLADIQGKLTAAISQVEQKLQTAEGLEIKELRTIFCRLQKSQKGLDSIKEKCRVLNRSMSLGFVSEAVQAVKSAEEKVNAIVPRASSPAELPVLSLQDTLQEAKACVQLVSEAQKLIAKGQHSQTMLEAKVEFARLQLRCKAMERKCKAAVDSLGAFCERVASEASQAVLDALRTAARRGEGGTFAPDELFDELSSGGKEISEKQICDFFGTYGMSKELSEEKVQFALRQIAPQGLTRRAFAALLADFQRVARDITITDQFEIQSAKKVRKLEVGETVEVLSTLRNDESLGLERLQCRAIRDGVRGWVTFRSSAGTTYLTRTEKPFLWCAQDVVLRSMPDENADAVRVLRAGEVLEFLEGPREERLGSDRRVRGLTCHEEASGWLQVSDKGGAVLAKENSKVHKCIEAIAMTDLADFTACTMVRRIDVGEALELIPSEESTPSEGGTRRKFRACRDGAEGWVTTHGSQGTVYVKAAHRHYVCLQACPVHAGLGAESAVVRVLMPGEAFAAFEDPKDVSGGDRLIIYRARAVVDGSEGWVVSASDQEVKAWRSTYKVIKTQPLTRALATNEAAEAVEVIRVLETDEIVEVSEQPTEDSSTGQLRVRCMARKDKAVGWATVRESDAGGTSAMQMRPIAPDEESAPEDLGQAAPITPPLEAPGQKAGKGQGGPKGKGKGRGAPAVVAQGQRQQEFLDREARRGHVEVKQEAEEETRWSGNKGGWNSNRGWPSGSYEQSAKRYKSGQWR